MEKLKMHSPDFVKENIARLAELFPNCVTESKADDGSIKRSIDFDQLRQEMSGSIVEGPQERYQINWPGKREALLTANAPIAKTLRPCREESVDFDTTKNLFIEGDNLDALKLLQETYLGKVKMIYIDPPYNTGNDFIYEDDFAENAEVYMERSNQKDVSGNRMVANTESNGRFHSDWLSMMYSRLKLARMLLRDDGIFIASLDDNEIHNFKKVCDEIFGDKNFLFQVTMLCNPKGRSQDKYVANCHEYLIAYSKGVLEKGSVDIPKSAEEVQDSYKLKDGRGVYRELELRNTHREFGRFNRSKMYYPFFVDSSGGVFLSHASEREPIFPVWEDGFEGCWTWGAEKAKNQLNEIIARKIKGTWKIFRKNYAFGEDGEANKQVKSIWTDKAFHTEKGQASFNELFETKGKIFQSPKSIDTLKQLLQMASGRDSLIVDFFSGSGSMAQATMEMNFKDNSKRRYLLVQIPDATDQASDAFKLGYKTIAEIGKERIRRAGNKIKIDNAGKDGLDQLDIGFRVLKIDSSNMRDIYYTPDAIKQDDLLGQISNIREDRSSEDLLFQVLLDLGVDLSLPIAQEIIDGKTVFFVNTDALAACFDTGIDEDFIKTLAARQPQRAIFRDAGFKDSATKINVEQIFKLLSPKTDVKCL